jgi:hypothetical protein
MTAATIKASMAVSEAGSNAFSSGPYWNGEMSALLTLSDGTTANKADLSYMSERTVASATNDDIDVAGVLADALGNTITAAELVAIFLINKQQDGTANTTDLTIDQTVTNGVVGFLDSSSSIGPIKPGGVFMLAAGDAAGIGAVTASTGDIIRITNSSGAANTYQIAILARSA